VVPIAAGMTTIRTTCPKCGAVEMGIEGVLLSLQDSTGEGCYRFLCPGCLDTVEKPADQKIVALLLSVGVDVEGLERAEDEPTLWHPSVDSSERLEERLEERPEGPPFTVDDLITFHFLLQDDERLARELAVS
jgi:hypothetical protein